jgi:hypothetical protein
VTRRFRYKIPSHVTDFDYMNAGQPDPLAVYDPPIANPGSSDHVARSCCSLLRIIHIIIVIIIIRYPVFRSWFRLEALGLQGSAAAPDFKAVVGMMCGDLGVPLDRLAPGCAPILTCELFFGMF